MNTDNLKKEIKKVKVWHISVLCAGIFLAFGIIGSIMIAAGGGWVTGQGLHIGWDQLGPIGPGKTFDVNDHGEMDLAGVDAIVIKTVSDNVAIQSDSGKITADLTGQCRSVTQPVRLNAHKDGSTYTIEVVYPHSMSNSTTHLSVAIPAEYTGSLSVETVSGDVQAQGLPNKLGQVTLHSTSGGVAFGATACSALKASTVSGDIALSNILTDTTATSTSGSIDLDYAAAAATTASTISGDIKAHLPQAAQFGVDFGTVSGSFSSNHPGLSVSSASHGFKSNADGKPLIKANTVSGDFEIEGKQ